MYFGNIFERLYNLNVLQYYSFLEFLYIKNESQMEKEIHGIKHLLLLIEYMF